PLICYEAIFPQEISAEIGNSDAILNITNDAWFGNTPGPYQHFQQARLRAVETGLPLIRGANSGISALVDPFGRVVAGMGFNQKGFLDASWVEMRVPSWSPFVRTACFTLILISMFLVAAIARIGFGTRHYPFR